jgi:L-asparagine transporter-like permease
MDREAIPMYVALAGTILTILSFLLYVFLPNNIYIALFVTGVIMMVVGYVIIDRTNAHLNRELENLKSKENDLRGEIISLDGPYVPSEECGPIESLENL